MMEAIETERERHRPKRITTLFVGESAPDSGDFFYYGDNAMFQHMRRAVESVFGKSDDFLQTFKDYGWYLDDLVLTPVNKLPISERKAKCLEARGASPIELRFTSRKQSSLFSSSRLWMRR